MAKVISFGDAVIISPNDICKHTMLDKSGDFRNREVYVPSDLMKRICDNLSPSLYSELENAEYPSFFHLSYNATNMLEEMLSVLNLRQPTPELDQIHYGAVTLLLTIFSSFKGSASIYPVWMNKLLQLLCYEEFITKPISEIVSSTNYSHGFVCRTFKKYLSQTLKEYVNRKKLEFSRFLLSNKELTVEAIALRLKFGTASNYIKQFKEEFKLTPTQWRKKNASSIDLYPNHNWGGFIKKSD